MPNENYYKRHKLEMKEYQRNRKQIYWGLIAHLKVSEGCKKCKFNADSNKLHLHHRDPSIKLFSIADGHLYKESAYLAEIEKCDVLCVECHAKAHSALRQKQKGNQTMKGRRRRSRAHGGSSVVGGVSR